MIGFRQWVVAVLSAFLLHAVIILPFVLDTKPASEHLAGGLEIGLGTGMDIGDGTGEFAADGEGGKEGELEPPAEKPVVEPVVNATAMPIQPKAVAVVNPEPTMTTAVSEQEPEHIEAQLMEVSDNVMVVEHTPVEPIEKDKTEIEAPVVSKEQPQAEENNTVAAVADQVSQSMAESGKQGVASGDKQGGKPGSRYGNGKPGGNGMAGGNGKGNGRILRGYFSDVAALIDAHKDYPGEVKKEKQEGTVIVAFSINRKGELLSSVIQKSSGYALLDKAALATLERSNPFPPIPKAIERDTLKIAVPIDYTLITH